MQPVGLHTVVTRPWVIRHAWLVVTAGAVLAACALLLAVFSPHVYGSTSGLAAADRAKQLADDRDFGFKLATGAGAVAAALLAWGRFEMTKEQADLDRVKADVDRAKADVDRARLDSERFTRAVENLADQREAVALGGVYSLRDLGNTSPGYQIPVTDVLCAVLRSSTADRHDEASRTDFDAEDIQVAELLEQAHEQIRTFNTIELAIVAVLQQRDGWHGTINLRGAQLFTLRVALTDWSGADLSSCDLRQATFFKVNLTNAKMQAAALDYADLSETELSQADLSWATIAETRIPRHAWDEISAIVEENGSFRRINPMLARE